MPAGRQLMEASGKQCVSACFRFGLAKAREAIHKRMDRRRDKMTADWPQGPTLPLEESGTGPPVQI